MSLNARRENRSVYRALKRLKAGDPVTFSKRVAELLPPPPPVSRRALPRRITLLHQASTPFGIGLGQSGVVDRDMRALMTEGLLVASTQTHRRFVKRSNSRKPMPISQRFGKEAMRTTSLHLTEAGQAYLARTNYLFQQIHQPNPPVGKKSSNWYCYTDETRRVLLGDVRHDVRRIRAPKGNEPDAFAGDSRGQPVLPEERYLVFGFRDGETVFHHDEFALSEAMIPAGRLRETGRGLAMDKVDVLEVSLATGEPSWSSRPHRVLRKAEREELLNIAPSVVFVERLMHLYVVVDCTADLVAAKIVFGDGHLVTQFTLPSKA